VESGRTFVLQNGQTRPVSPSGLLRNLPYFLTFSRPQISLYHSVYPHSEHTSACKVVVLKRGRLINLVPCGPAIFVQPHFGHTPEFFIFPHEISGSESS